MSKYRYESSHHWLADKIQRTSDINELKGIINSVLEYLDSDNIQDVFENEMDEDGYFELIE